jgi:hypothetical protein
MSVASACADAAKAINSMQRTISDFISSPGHHTLGDGLRRRKRRPGFLPVEVGRHLRQANGPVLDRHNVDHVMLVDRKFDEAMLKLQNSKRGAD